MLNVNISIVVLQTYLKEIHLYQTVEYCLKHMQLTAADAYDVLRATNLNDLLKFVIHLLKRETISMSYKYIINQNFKYTRKMKFI